MMPCFAKKSKIVNWWIAPQYSELKFVNIFSREALKENLIVVGTCRDEQYSREFWTSSNRVVKVTSKGVLTAQGTFYPFKEAHRIYLKFLVESNNGDPIFAYKWEYLDEQKTRVIANIVTTTGTEINKVKFDFDSVEKEKLPISGFSEKLNSKVVFSSFDKDGFCIRFEIPEDVKDSIYRTIKIEKKELKGLLRSLKRIFQKEFIFFEK